MKEHYLVHETGQAPGRLALGRLDVVHVVEVQDVQRPRRRPGHRAPAAPHPGPRRAPPLPAPPPRRPGRPTAHPRASSATIPPSTRRATATARARAPSRPPPTAPGCAARFRPAAARLGGGSVGPSRGHAEAAGGGVGGLCRAGRGVGGAARNGGKAVVGGGGRAVVGPGRVGGVSRGSVVCTGTYCVPGPRCGGLYPSNTPLSFSLPSLQVALLLLFDLF